MDFEVFIGFCLGVLAGLLFFIYLFSDPRDDEELK